MNFKFAIAASALMASAGIFSVGCGGTDCDKASDQLTACGIMGSALSDSAAMPPACAASVLCTSQCINKATCDQLTDAFSGMPSANNPFLKCTEPCKDAK